MPGSSPYRRLIPPAALWLGATALALPGVLRALDWAGFSATTEARLSEISATAAWLAAAWFGARLFHIVISRGDRPVPRLLGDMVAIILFVAAIIVILGSVYNQPVGALVTTSGVVVAVLGFSLRELITDIFAGVCINMERPYALGDWLEIPPGPQVGKVAEINWRATRLVTLDGITVVVPNGVMARSRFLNYSIPKRPFRVNAAVTLGYGVPIERARRLLIAAARGTAGVLPHPEPSCIVESFSDHGVRYLIRFWVPDFEPMVPVRSEVLASIQRHLRMAGVPLRHAFQELSVARTRFDEATDDRRLSLLRQIELFQALDDGDIAQLCEAMTVHRERSGSVVVKAGDPGSSLFVVVEGLLEVKGKDGAGVLATLSPGDVFGEMSLLTGAPRSATVAVASDAVLFEIFDRQLAPILHRRPDLAEELGRIVDKRQRANEMRGGGDVRTAARAMQPVLLARIRDWFGLS